MGNVIVARFVSNLGRNARSSDSASEVFFPLGVLLHFCVKMKYRWILWYTFLQLNKPADFEVFFSERNIPICIPRATAIATGALAAGRGGGGSRVEWITVDLKQVKGKGQLEGKHQRFKPVKEVLGRKLGWQMWNFSAPCKAEPFNWHFPVLPGLPSSDTSPSPYASPSSCLLLISPLPFSAPRVHGRKGKAVKFPPSQADPWVSVSHSMISSSWPCHPTSGPWFSYFPMQLCRADWFFLSSIHVPLLNDTSAHL